MSQTYNKQYVLKDDGSATPVFSIEDKKPLSYQESPGSLLLRSGSLDQAEQAGCPVSTALQLNGDLTGMKEDSLAAFARAELEKHHTISYRTYDVDPDFRVCVLADQAADLAEFIATYGGILEIEPLLVGGYHPDYDSAEEIEISALGRGYSVQYTRKSVVDRSLCNYCGLCGRICPVQCISAELHFDFSICTFCTDCEKQCPEKAIDLHAIERINLEIPALIVLGEPRLTLPDKRSSIYNQKNMSEFLATLYSCRVDEVITCNHELCHYTKSSKTGCKACLGSCRYGAIKIKDNQIQIDPFACTECGGCVSVCPTGALQNQKLTDQAFIDFFRSFPLPRNSTVIIGSAADLNRSWWQNSATTYGQTCFLEVPESATLTLMNLLFLIAHGSNRLVILSSLDSSDSNLFNAVRETNLLCEKFIGTKELVTVCKPEELSPDLALRGTTELDFSPYGDLGFINRRQKLSSILQFFSARSETEISLEQDEVRFIGTITCDDDRCTQCLACLNSCKIESLSANSSTLSLCWNGSLCVGCQSCVEACPEDALSYASEATLNQDYFSPAEVSRAEPMACEGCGKVFGTKKSFDRVMTILAKKQQTVPEHLHYCEDCRVLKLLENQ